MHRDHLDPVAAHLIASYVDTASYSRQFRDDHETPPSLMAKVHHLRSIVQARMTADDRFELSQPYAEYGRVQFTDRESGSKLLLRSAGALAVEKAKKSEQLALFAFAKLIKASDIQVLIYEFGQHGLSLSIAAASHRPGGKRLMVHGEPTLVGFWPYLPGDEPQPFDQDAADPFGDVGGLDEEGDETGGAV